MWAVARAHGLGPADASEVSQVTWLLLTQHLSALQPPERLGSWLLRTATREAYRMGRLRGWLSPDEYEEAYYTSMASGTLALPSDAR